MDDLKKLIAARLRSARQHRNLNQSDVADYLEIDRSAYAHIESGRNWLTVPNLVKISRIFNKSIAWFVGEGEGELTGDELELIEAFRDLPGQWERETGLMLLKGWSNQVGKKTKNRLS